MKFAVAGFSKLLNCIALFFVQTASPAAHQPEIPEELK